jgi:glycogen debranching enzyme
MVTAGDERGKTQLGNNNAYCQDSNLSWVNWDLTRSQKDLETTFGYLTKLRKENPTLRPNNFGSFERIDVGLDRIRWFNSTGHMMTGDDWQNSETRTVMRFSQNLNTDGETNETLLIVHGAETEMVVQLPTELEIESYELLWNSALELPPSDITELAGDSELIMSGSSMVLLRVKKKSKQA